MPLSTVPERLLLAGRRCRITGAKVVAVSLVVVGFAACRDVTGTQLPAGTSDPSFYNSAKGALGMRNAAVLAVANALPTAIIISGLLSDELENPSTGAGQGANLANGGVVADPLDERVLPEMSFGSSGGYASDAAYNQLQGVRTAISQAIGALAAYDSAAKDTAILKPAVDSVLRGELYALEGYDEVMLADLFCSGVPLSTLDFQKDFTYRAGVSTTELYQDALAKFDTALALSSDTGQIVNLARVGKGRAYLQLGQPAGAAAAVSAVPDGFQYQLSTRWRVGSQTTLNSIATVSDTEGGNGLPFISSGDPRSADTTFQLESGSFANTTVGFPVKYISSLNGDGYSIVTLSDWVEARLIQAEAALQVGQPSWLSLLNDLRATAPIPGTSEPAPDKLPPLTDPGTDSARVALVFQERGFWLYLTGHRQGDLRRLLRQYARYWPTQSQVYPSGAYLGVGAGVYGPDVTAPIPAAEYINPYFRGCLSRAP